MSSGSRSWEAHLALFQGRKHSRAVHGDHGSFGNIPDSVHHDEAAQQGLSYLAGLVLLSRSRAMNVRTRIFAGVSDKLTEH